MADDVAGAAAIAAVAAVAVAAAEVGAADAAGRGVAGGAAAVEVAGRVPGDGDTASWEHPAEAATCQSWASYVPSHGEPGP